MALVPAPQYLHTHDALKWIREQVARAFFEIHAIEAGIGVKNYPSGDFETFILRHLYMFSNFSMDVMFDWFSNIFPQKKKKKCIFWLFFFFKMIVLFWIVNFKGQFLKITLPKKLLKVLYTSDHISKIRSINLIFFGTKLKLRCAHYNDTKNSFCPKRHLSPVLWEFLTLVQPSMGTLNSPSSRVSKDLMPSQCQILRCINFGISESSPNLF